MFEPPKYITSLIAAVNDGAKAAQGGAFLFLLVGLYLVATAFGVSDEDLLLGRTVTISQIGATLPVSFSFAIAPMVFVFLHIYTLVRYDMLAENVRQFRRDLHETVKVESDRRRCRQLLTNVEFVETLTTPRTSAEYSRIWSLLFLGIVAVFPVTVLLLVQINALRYQSELITNVQRVWLILDLGALVWFFSRGPLNADDERRVHLWRRSVRWGLLICPPALVIGLNFFWFSTVPTTPDQRINEEESLVAELILQPLDVACWRLNWGCRFLRVDHRTLVDKVWDDKAMNDLRMGGSDATKALAGIEGVALRGRSLRFAVLAWSRLYAADLMYADLTLADLTAAQLNGANLWDAHLTRANLNGADLTRAELFGADLTGANLFGVQLTGATLTGAQLNSTNLYGAHLNGANLLIAHLNGANLTGADLHGATLNGADLIGAAVTQAQLDQACGTNAKLNPGLTLKPCP